MERDWIDYASAYGSISTTITLIILIVKSWQTRKDITDLSVLAKHLGEQTKTFDDQNKLIKLQLQTTVEPKFEYKRAFYDKVGELDRLVIVFYNRAKFAAKVESVKFTSPSDGKEVLLTQEWSYTMQRLMIMIKLYKPEHFTKTYPIHFIYFDTLGNQYHLFFEVTGTDVVINNIAPWL